MASTYKDYLNRVNASAQPTQAVPSASKTGGVSYQDYLNRVNAQTTQPAQTTNRLEDPRVLLQQQLLQEQNAANHAVHDAKWATDEAYRRNYAAQMQQAGRVGAGNIDLFNRPRYQNEDGTFSTLDIRSYNIDGKETLLPSVWWQNGKPYHASSDDEVIQHYRDTGEYLGKFDTVDEANRYAQHLHNQQAEYYSTQVQPKETQKTGREKIEDYLRIIDNSNYYKIPLLLDQLDLWLTNQVNKLPGVNIDTTEVKNRIASEQQSQQEELDSIYAGHNQAGKYALEGVNAAYDMLGDVALFNATGIPGALSQGAAMLGAAAPATQLGMSGTQKAVSAVQNAGSKLATTLAKDSFNAAISTKSALGTYTKAIQSGASEEAASRAGLQAGLLEYFSNKLFGGTPFEDTDSGAVTKVVEKILDKLGKKEQVSALLGTTAGKVFTAIFDKIGEGLEEVVTGIGDPIIERLNYNPDADSATLDDLADEFIVGFLMSTILGVPGEVVSTYRTGKENAQIRGIGKEMRPYQNDIISEGMESGEDTDSHKQAVRNQQRVDAGKRISNRALGQQYIANVAAIDEENARNATQNVQEATQNAQEATQETRKGSPIRTILPAPRSTAQVNIADIQQLNSLIGTDTVNRNMVDSVIGNPQMLNTLAKVTDSDFSHMQGAERRNAVANAINQLRGTILGSGSVMNGLDTTRRNAIMNSSNNEGGADNGRGAESISRDGGRDAGLAAAEQGSSVAARTGEAEVRGQGSAAEGGRTVRWNLKTDGSVNYKSAEGVENAASADEIRQAAARLEKRTDGRYKYTQYEDVEAKTNAQKKIVKEAADKGQRVHYFKGDLWITQNGETFRARGMISGDGKNVWIKTDHGTLTEEQIYKHEDYHASIKGNRAILEEGIRMLKDKYDEEHLTRLVQNYAQNYHMDGEYDPEYVLEEILADAHAGIDVQMVNDESQIVSQKNISKIADKALKANKNAASENGAARFSRQDEVLSMSGIDWMDNNSSIKAQLKKHSAELNKMKPVAVVSYTHNTKESIVDIMMTAVSRIGGQNMKNSGVSFAFDKAGASSINTHAKTPELRAAAVSAPYIAKYGKLIAGQKNHEGAGLTTLTFAAPVEINGTKVTVGLVIQFQENGRPRAVNVELQDGGNFKIKNEASKGSSSRVDRYSQGTTLDTMDTSDGKNTTEGAESQDKSESGVKTSRESDAEYMELAKDPEKNQLELQRSVNASAKEAGAILTPNGRRPLDLYRGVNTFFDSNQVKSADPVTYDDNGNVIPLSERFNQNNEDIRYSRDVDSDGNELSDQQAAYFKDSKIRDENGKLKLMYHGTAEDFTVFEPRSKGGKNGTAEGYGIYFADTTDVTDAYGGKTLNGYVNITRPARSDAKTLKRTEIVKLIKQTCMAEANRMVAEDEYSSVNEAIRDTWISNYVDTYSQPITSSYNEVANNILRTNDSDMDIVQEIMVGIGVRSYEDAYDFYDTLKSTTGIDGYVTQWENRENPDKPSMIVVAFDSNQFKNADNKNPTASDDIRYSRESDADYSTLQKQNKRLQKQVEYWQAQSKATKGWKADAKQEAANAKSIVQSVSSKANVDEVTKRITKLHEDMSNGKLTYEEGKAEAVSIAADIINKSTAMVSKDEESYREAKRIFRSTAQTDVAYKQLQQMFGEDMFPPAISSKEMLDNINEYFDLVKPIAENPYDFGKAMVIESVANDIVDSGMEIQQAAPSAVDKERAKAAEAKEKAKRSAEEQQLVDAMYYGRLLAEERAKHKEAIAKERGRTSEAKAQAEADAKQQREITNAEKSVLRDQRDAKLAEQQSYYQDMVERLRKQKDAKIEGILQHQRDVNKNRREMRQEASDRNKLLKIVRRLTGKKIDPATRAMLPDIVKELDTISVNITGKTIENLSALKDWYDSKTNKNDAENYDPNFIPDKATKAKLDRLEKAMRGNTIGEMSIDDVRALTEVLQNIEHNMLEGRKFQNSQIKIDNYNAAMQVINDVDNARGGKIDRKLNPLRAIRRIVGYADGSIAGTVKNHLITLTEEMIDGGRKAKKFESDNIHRFDKWLNDKEFMRGLYGKHAKSVYINGVNARTGAIERVEITPAMRISLYLHSLNDDNMRHIQGAYNKSNDSYNGGGLLVPDMAEYRKGNMEKAYAADHRIKLTKANVNAICAKMDAKEMSFAKAMYTYFNDIAPKALNEASMLIDGYEKFNVENYFPISVDKNFLNQDFEGIKVNDDGSLTHPGFGEERIQSSKPIYLRDVNTVLMTAIRQNSMYAHQAVPLMNMSKVLNVQSMESTDSVQAALGRKYGDGSATRYIKKFMQDYAGNKNTSKSTIDKALAKMRSNYSGGVLTLSAGTAIKQAASYPGAAAILSASSLAKGITGKLDVSFIDEMTSTYSRRKEGFSNIELAEMAQQGKHIPAALNWIQAVDVATTNRLKQACAYEVMRQGKFTPGTMEYKKAVVDLYNRVIEETQPNYSAELRPDILRSDSARERSLVMFATQPMQNFGILYDAIGNYRAKSVAYQNAKSKETAVALKDARTALGKAVGSQVAAGVVFSLMQYIWDAFRRKDDKYRDDGELTVFSWLKGIGLNLLGNGAGMFVGGKVALDFAETLADSISTKLGGEKIFNAYNSGFEVAELAAITDVEDSLSSLATTIAGQIGDKEFDASEMARSVWSTAETVSIMFGIPLKNVTTDLTAIAKNVVGAVNHGEKYIGNYYILAIDKEPEANKQACYQNLWLCYKNGSSRELKQLYREMLDDGFTDTQIKNAMEKRMKEEQGVNSVDKLKRRWEDII